MRAFDDLRLSRKLVLLVMAVIGCVACAGVALVGLVKHELMVDRIRELHAIVDSAGGFAAVLQKQVETGEVTRDQARQTFSRNVGSMVYDGGEGYVFAYRMDGTVVATPDVTQIGMNKLHVVMNGREVIREIRDAVQGGGGAVIRYDFPHPGQTVPAPKVSYAVMIPALDMFIGSGSYVDDLDARLKPLLWKLVAGLACLAAVIGAVAWMITRCVVKPLARLEGSMKGLASGNLDLDVPGIGRRDEVGAMADAVQVFKLNALHARAMERERDEARERRMVEDERVRRDAEQAAAVKAADLVVGSIGAGLGRMAAGDLTYRLEAPLPEAYEKLRADLNAATTQLQDLVRSIVVNTVGIRSGTEEITGSADDLSRRTEQQAASLEQTAAALDEITVTVRKTADGAEQARAVVLQTKLDAERSEDVMRQAVSAMGGIERSSRKIGQIIGVIDEIAFQTNLLALNAGVEAARAGDAGRGFAVVASEVRALAQRSSEAAKEIKDLVSDSARQVDHGVKLVGETGQALNRIVVQVGQVTAVVAEIATSAQEQSTALHEVNTAINQMDQVTQQNAAMVEQSKAASHSLASKSAELTQLTGRFQVRAAIPAFEGKRGSARHAA